MRPLRYILIVVIGLVTVSSLFLTPQAAAATFTPNNIISDSVFNNTTAMTASQIDSWLNSNFGSNSCISTSHGFSAPDPTGYNPTQGFLYGGNVSAGQVIYDAAQAYGLNPQVLLITLQKEQSLVSGTAGCSTLRYAGAAGYGCPDGGTTYNYSGVNLYSINGVAVTSVSGTCVNSSLKVGFSQQVIRATWLLKFGEQRSEGNVGWEVIKGNWNNSDDPQSCYAGPMTQGTFARCPSGGSAYYDGYTTIDGTSTHMDNGATAALYWYTPHFSGNQHFFNLFTGWFVSTQTSIYNCDSRVSGVACVWSLTKTDGSQFLTSSKTELSNALYQYGWTYVGIAFYAPQAQKQGSVPIYRLRNGTAYYYTSDQTEKDTLISSGGWADEGTVFYAYPITVSGSVAHKIYKLYNSTTNRYYWTADGAQEQSLLNSGYTSESNNYNGFSNMADLPAVSSDRDNIYELGVNNGYFYTAGLSELETAIGKGFEYKGVLTTANSASTGTAVYRLRSNNGYFYTANPGERDIAVNSYGMTYEGIGFYLDATSAQIYRLYNTSSDRYLYTSDIATVMTLTNTSGWTYQGLLVDKQSTPSPVYRFLNLQNNRHFYTIDINEATQITNKHWRYETIAFYASRTSGLPVYRLLLYDKHFYTTDTNERDLAVSKYGYRYEEIAFYASAAPTTTPVYRLQGGNDEYFYTASSAEKDTAVSKYGYRYEEVGFYLPS